MSRPATWLISLGCALVYLPLPLAANWGPRTMGELIGQTELHTSQLFAWFYLGVAVGCPISGWISSRIGRARSILLLGAACTSGLTITLALLSNPSQAEIAMLLLAWGAATSTYVLGYPMAAGLSPRDAHGSAIAFVNFVAMMLAFGFVWIFGVVVDAFASARGHISHPVREDFQSTLLWTGVLVGLAVILVAMARSKRSDEC